MSTLFVLLLLAVVVVVGMFAALFGVVWFAGRSGRREQVRRFGGAT